MLDSASIQFCHQEGSDAQAGVSVSFSFETLHRLLWRSHGAPRRPPNATLQSWNPHRTKRLSLERRGHPRSTWNAAIYPKEHQYFETKPTRKQVPGRHCDTQEGAYISRPARLRSMHTSNQHTGDSCPGRALQY